MFKSFVLALLAARGAALQVRARACMAARPTLPRPALQMEAPVMRRLPQQSLPHRLTKALPLAALGGAILLGAGGSALAADIASADTAAGVLDNGFIQATSLIFLSEIGDKTFFIASILAAKASRAITFVGSFSALVLMTVISVAIGQIFHAVPESFTGGLPLDDYVAIASFLFFGFKSISDALSIQDGDVSSLDEELAEAEAALAEGNVLERTRGKAFALAGEAFALTVAAEIGDRSQIATIALSAAQNPFVVGGGACLGHGMATGIAVLGGSLISKYVNEKGILLIAGVLFLLFALTTALPLLGVI
ncbi:hypothetical protein M885DRAFT_520252 [Pelagophyceae sp. CCMP2097]|nr:hypothetical protein M885DRAFT_520252 [Pelagophyceae sp. CCMP2097]